jgi:hypothetical protein
MGYGIVPPGAFSGLAWSQPPAPILFGLVWGNDGISHRCRFDIYDIWACPAGVNAVYIFARLEGSTYVPIYVGRAEILSRRLTSHDRRDEAIRHGARFLLVHIPAPLDPISYIEAERRLIQQYTPVLNEQLNPLAALFAR